MQKDESVNYIQIIYMLHAELQQTVLFHRNACDANVKDLFVGVWQSAKCEQAIGGSQRCRLFFSPGQVRQLDGTITKWQLL